MKKIIMIFTCMLLSATAHSADYKLIIEDIKRNLNVDGHYIKVGQYLYLNDSNVEDIKESLRQASIINGRERERILFFTEKAGLINKVERKEWLEQANTYNEIVKKLKRSVVDVDKELSYTTYSCDGIEDMIYYPNAINQFERALKISDVSAYQDFIRFFNDENIKIIQTPNPNSVIEHVSNKENIKLTMIEEKFIYNNATSVSMYNKVSLNDKVYDMFPYQMYDYPASKLEDLTALEYAWYALNLKLVGRLTPQIYNTYKKLFRRNASLCLYSK